MRPTRECRTRSRAPAALALARNALLPVLFLAIACGTPVEEPARELSPPPPRNVVVLVVDCLRADHVGAYGYHRPTTPNIDRLAADSLLFERAVSPSNWTKPSIASLITGTRVSQHRLTEGHASGDDGLLRSHVLSPDLVTIAEAFREAGHATGAFINQGHLAAYMGFDQGYDEYLADLHDPQVVERFAGWLDGIGERPFFAYLHLLDLHFPYTAQDHIDIFTEETGERRIKSMMRSDTAGFHELVETDGLSEADKREVAALYDGELLGVDDTVRRALAVLADRALYEDAFVVLTSDHGEAFWEHGRFEHGDDILWDEVVRVPLLIKLPGNRHAGRRLAETVRVIDVMPTLLEAQALSAVPGIGGLPLLTRTPSGLEPRIPEAPAIAETSDLDGPKAIYRGDLKFLFGAEPGDVRVFDLATDPGETRDLADELAPSVLAAARADLDRLLAEGAAFAERLSLTETELRPEEIEKLRALGYIR